MKRNMKKNHILPRALLLCAVFVCTGLFCSGLFSPVSPLVEESAAADTSSLSLSSMYGSDNYGSGDYNSSNFDSSNLGSGGFGRDNSGSVNYHSGDYNSTGKDPWPISAEPIYLEPWRESFYLNVNKKYPDLELDYHAHEESNTLPDGSQALSVDQNGLVTMLTDRPGSYCVIVHSKETETSKECEISATICIPLRDQTLTGATKLKTDFGKTIKVKAKAKTHITYRSDTPSIAKVDSSGTVTFLRPGKATVVAVADSDDIYKSNCLVIKITCKLGKPTVKATAGKRKVRLKWNKIPKAQKYLIYCKYPGKKKYKLVDKRSGLVKGITHYRLKKGKKYSYKVRAYMKLKGKKYYSSSSKPVTIKVK